MMRDATEIARACADAMWAEDKASRAMGMQIVDMVNGHGLCHGGYIFSLADPALAFACNSHNQRHVAQHCQNVYLAPGRLGMRLLAEARERHWGERSGMRTEDGETIAEFRGHSRPIPGALITAA